MSNRVQSFSDTLRHPVWYWTVGIVVGLIIGITAAWPVAAQFIDPSGLPPGGRSASWLTTSNLTQHKLGSLLIGDSALGSQRELCLNGASGTACVSSWTQAATGVGGPFVRVYPPPDPFVSPEFRQVGYARIIGTDNRSTFKSDAEPGNGIKTGIYAATSRDYTGYAAAFSGRVQIINDTASNPGQLCLNTTALYNPAVVTFYQGQNRNFGCIQNWSDLQSTSIGAYLRVQNTKSPNLQVGAGWIGTDQEYSPGVPATHPGAMQFGSAVVGGVVPNPPGPAPSYYCGDGLCSSEIGESSSCPADCS